MELDRWRRVVSGEVNDFFDFMHGDGSVERRAVTTIIGMTWEVPLSMFTDAGYEAVEVGTQFKSVWPIGKIPRVFDVMPVERPEGV